MNKLVFIIGMRRSGTSILRKLVELHPEVERIEFEPNELLEVCERIGIPRYKNIPYFNEVINRFKKPRDKWYGAKLALNVGLEAMRWLRFEEQFDKPYYIFIQRNPSTTYDSWVKNETSSRGVCPKEMYLPWWKHINKSFEQFVKENPDRTCIVQYEDLCDNADLELEKVWNLMGIEVLKNLQGYIK